MKVPRLVYFTLLFLILIILIVFLTSDGTVFRRVESVNSSQEEVSNGAPDRRSSDSSKEAFAPIDEVVSGILSSPINFYGKVIDQFGQPIPGASIAYTVTDKLYESGSSYRGASDAEGNFSISRKRGAVLSVGVRKAGYYPIRNRSSRSFAFGISADSTRSLPPSANAPEIFVLHKKGDTQPLLRVRQRQFDLPKNGNTVKIDISTGEVGAGELEIQSFLGDIRTKPYPWMLKLSVADGGILEKNGEFEFVAPFDGYKEDIEIKMSAEDRGWASGMKKEFFIRKSDGRFARIKVEYFSGKRNFVALESYVNPVVSQRNLEFDREKEIDLSERELE